ncbi:MAG TPA: serine/threonine-protein kinase [Burkholderiaceae bacterium]|nr:serine/threonine-protein kinase [Burkholderiaceae bacterium]
MELVRVLASGGFGIVYLARDHWLDRDVAVKEFLPAHLAGRGDDLRVELRTDAGAAEFAQGLQSFIAEAKLLAHFSHPAIVKVHRYWEANGTGYMVMPYLRGPTLGQVRRSMSQAPTEEWLRSIMEPLMGALAMLHAESVYHRDISPDNVLVSENNGAPILLDFGAARSIGNGQSHSPTAILKPRFAPIEQYAEATHLRQGPWTDIYSLGALIAYLLVGTAPPQSTARAIDDEMKPLQGQRIDGVSRSFLSAIDWALGVRPQDRPQSIAELREALDGPAVAQRARSDAPRATTRELHRRPDDPFAATLQLDRPLLSPKVRERAGRAALLAFAGVALVVAVAPLAPVALPTPPQVAAAPELIRERVHEPVMAQAKEKPASKVAAVPSEILTPTTAASTTANDAHAERLDDRPKARPSTSASASHKATKKRAPQLAGQFEARGPASQCSTRGFFQRPHCMQRACKEPRFQSNVQCMPFQQEARLEHY